MGDTVDDGLVRLAAGLALAATGFALSGEAFGSGFQLRENSAAALGSAFAGAAVSTEDPSIIANNPAGMTSLFGNQLSGDLSIVIPSAIFSGAGFTAAGQPIRGGNGGDAGSAQPVPAVYGLYDATADLKFGLAVTAPFGLDSQYNSNWIGRYQAIKSDLQIININPNIAYRITDWLSMGAGPAIQHASVELTNGIDSTTLLHLANPLLPAGLTLPDGFARVTGDSWSVGYNLGVLAEISPETRLGASYRSQISHRLDGSVTFNVPIPLAADPRFRNTPTRADLKTPDIVSFAAYQQISPDLTLLAEAQWTSWSVIKNLQVQRTDGSVVTNQPEQWHGTWFGSIGASYVATPNWAVRGGFAYDHTPVRDQFRSARLPDADRYWLAVGVGYQWTAALRFDAAYVHIFSGGNTSINEVSQTGDLLVGRYSDHIDILSVSATHRF
jgi:long-chain fatty acid transport protein